MLAEEKEGGIETGLQAGAAVAGVLEEERGRPRDRRLEEREEEENEENEENEEEEAEEMQGVGLSEIVEVAAGVADDCKEPLDSMDSNEVEDRMATLVSDTPDKDLVRECASFSTKES